MKVFAQGLWHNAPELTAFSKTETVLQEPGPSEQGTLHPTLTGTGSKQVPQSYGLINDNNRHC